MSCDCESLNPLRELAENIDPSFNYYNQIDGELFNFDKINKIYKKQEQQFLEDCRQGVIQVDFRGNNLGHLAYATAILDHYIGVLLL